jgi:hypothetical protein
MCWLALRSCTPRIGFFLFTPLAQAQIPDRLVQCLDERIVLPRRRRLFLLRIISPPQMAKCPRGMQNWIASSLALLAKRSLT